VARSMVPALSPSTLYHSNYASRADREESPPARQITRGGLGSRKAFFDPRKSS